VSATIVGPAEHDNHPRERRQLELFLKSQPRARGERA